MSERANSPRVQNLTSLVPEIVTSLDERGVLEIGLQRPERRNAFTRPMVDELTRLFRTVQVSPTVRVVVLRGAGPVFCAGGDIGWMHQCGELDRDQRIENASAIGDLFSSIDACECPTVSLVQGAALGGGIGLVAASDFVIATDDAVFATSEVTLGIVPACLAPFLVAKVGLANARRMFLTGNRLAAAEAQRIGLVDGIAESALLSGAAAEVVDPLLLASPQAQRNAKRLLRRLGFGESFDVAPEREATIRLLAESWASTDGREGMKAFLEKRAPRWQEKSDRNRI